jgi:hypothetical protein
MQTDEFKISFWYRAEVDLADNEKVSLWEPTRSGTVRFQKDAIQLNGKWKVSILGTVLCSVILGELLIKPFFLKERTEIISVQNLKRVVILQKKKFIAFHLFQTRDQGMVEVHVFMADKNTVSQVIESLKAVVPANLLHEQNAG